MIMISIDFTGTEDTRKSTVSMLKALAGFSAAAAEMDQETQFFVRFVDQDGGETINGEFVGFSAAYNLLTVKDDEGEFRSFSVSSVYNFQVKPTEHEEPPLGLDDVPFQEGALTASFSYNDNSGHYLINDFIPLFVRPHRKRPNDSVLTGLEKYGTDYRLREFRVSGVRRFVMREAGKINHRHFQ
jgi:hypothetical protein